MRVGMIIQTVSGILLLVYLFGGRAGILDCME